MLMGLFGPISILLIEKDILSVKCLYFPIRNSKNVSYFGSLYEYAIL